MTRDQVLNAIRGGATTASAIAHVVGASKGRTADVLAYLTHTGDIIRTETRPWGAGSWSQWLYSVPEFPDRAARVERMREWAPAALADLRRSA